MIVHVTTWDGKNTVDDEVVFYIAHDESNVTNDDDDDYYIPVKASEDGLTSEAFEKGYNAMGESLTCFDDHSYYLGEECAKRFVTLFKATDVLITRHSGANKDLVNDALKAIKGDVERNFKETSKAHSTPVTPGAAVQPT